MLLRGPLIRSVFAQMRWPQAPHSHFRYFMICEINFSSQFRRSRIKDLHWQRGHNSADVSVCVSAEGVITVRFTSGPARVWPCETVER
ncbi:MAG: hypothetical protein JWN34_3005 [Bryobacterales bacterium]|nr:hypothetical protein [Bryobacterales bacterium]